MPIKIPRRVVLDSSYYRKAYKRPLANDMAEDDRTTEGIFAINKPADMSSAQVIRNAQSRFAGSQFFAAYTSDLKSKKQSSRKRKLNKDPRIKMGHGGTLDPMATGVLILGVGRGGTKQLPDFLSCTKTYEATVLFGVATDTYDRVGKVIAKKPFAHLTRTKLEEALSTFRGKIMQRPPIYSALHMDGKRLYDYARQGLALPREIQERPVEALELELTEWMEGGSHPYVHPQEDADDTSKKVAQLVLPSDSEQATLQSSSTAAGVKREYPETAEQAEQDEPQEKKIKLGEQPPEQDESAADELEKSQTETIPADTLSPKPPAAKLRMTVTSGFYVRSLCHDLGAAVGSLAIMVDLTRTRQADFELGKNVMEYEDINKGEEVWAPRLELLLDSSRERTRATQSDALTPIPSEKTYHADAGS